jgi:hypothetical protein
VEFFPNSLERRESEFGRARALTADVRDFDFLSQLAPNGRAIFYRRPSSEP